MKLLTEWEAHGHLGWVRGVGDADDALIRVLVVETRETQDEVLADLLDHVLSSIIGFRVRISQAFAAR